jgi:hypothetical protein
MNLLLLLSAPTLVAYAAWFIGYQIQVLYPRLKGPKQPLKGTK